MTGRAINATRSNPRKHITAVSDGGQLRLKISNFNMDEGQSEMGMELQMHVNIHWDKWDKSTGPVRFRELHWYSEQQFARVADLKAFQLEKAIPLQLGMAGSQSTINFGTHTRVQVRGWKEETYLDIVNVGHYNVILGVPFLNIFRINLDLEPRGVICNISTLGVDVMYSQEKEWQNCQLVGSYWRVHCGTTVILSVWNGSDSNTGSIAKVEGQTTKKMNQYCNKPQSTWILQLTEKTVQLADQVDGVSQLIQLRGDLCSRTLEQSHRLSIMILCIRQTGWETAELHVCECRHKVRLW